MATINSQGYASDVVVGSALPIEMSYALPASLPAAKSFEIRLQPINSQNFDTAGNVVQFDLPCGRPGQYLDPTSTYLRFRATYTHAGQTTTDTSRLIGSAYSYFQKQEVYGNNSVLLESINELGVLSNALLNLQLNDADKRGLSMAMGFDFDTGVNASSATAGHRINVASGIAGTSAAVLDGLVFDYAIPIIGILGSGTDKMFPIGEIYGLRYELTTDSFANYTRAVTGNAVQSCRLSDFEFVGNVIELSPEAHSLVIAQNPDKIRIRSQTYRQASNILTAGSAGTNDLLVGIRVSSLKSMYLCCSNSGGTNPAIEGKFSGVNPNLDVGTCYIIAGQNWPQRGLNPSGRPADAYMETQKALGSLSFNVFNGCISKNAYTAASGNYGLCTAFNHNIANITTDPNQFFLGIDTEVVSRKQNLLSGINVNSSPMFFRAQIGSALSAHQYNLNFFGYYDVILEIDRAQKNIVAKF